MSIENGMSKFLHSRGVMSIENGMSKFLHSRGVLCAGKPHTAPTEREPRVE